MSSFTPKIIVTSGEPAGIGPDVCLHLLKAKLPAHFSVLGDSVVFGQRAEQLGLQDALKDLNLISVPTKLPVVAGRLDVNNVPMVLEQLDIAVQSCMRKKYHAMLTAPIHKGIINEAGHSFTGHTEYLAKKTMAEKPVMMLACDAMRVALVTTHLPLEKVPAAINQESILRVLEVLYNDLKMRFGIKSPVIAVCGLNPHAGEQGHLGRAEIDIIEPSLELARESGLEVIGPLPADTAFTPKILNQVDAVLCMYHDQGLPVLKYASFGRGANITLGLPIIRTSVDHGTALDLAGTGRIDPGSIIAAAEIAIEMAHVSYSRKHGIKKPNKTQSAPASGIEPSINVSDEEIQKMFDLSLEVQQNPMERSLDLETEDLAESSDENTSFRNKAEQEMEMESTMSSDIDEAIKSMKNVLT